MYDPVPGGLLPHPLLDERLLRPEELHGQLVVCGLEDVLQLVPHPPWLGLRGDGDAAGAALGGGRRGHLLLWGPVQGYVVLFGTGDINIMNPFLCIFSAFYLKCSHLKWTLLSTPPPPAAMGSPSPT